MSYPKKIQVVIEEGKPVFINDTASANSLQEPQAYMLESEVARSVKGIFTAGSIDGLSIALRIMRKYKSYQGSYHKIISFMNTLQSGKKNAQGLSAVGVGSDTPALQSGDEKSSTQDANGGGEDNSL